MSTFVNTFKLVLRHFVVPRIPHVPRFLTRFSTILRARIFLRVPASELPCKEDGQIITFSLLLRTYFGPWLLRLLSRHIRIRSISLRSIRGLYFLKANRTLRVDRISWGWSAFGRSNRVVIKVEGLSIDIGVQEPPIPSAPRKRHNRKLTLANLSPSPIVRLFRSCFASIYNQLEPALRPILRHYAVVCLQFTIQIIPALTQALTFELQNAVVTFGALPGAKLVAEEIHLTASVDFMESEQEGGVTIAEPASSADVSRRQGVTAWSNRMREGFRRSLDRAWGMTRGKGTVGFKVYNVQGTMPHDSKETTSFLSLPDIIEMKAALDFNPRAGSIETHTLELSLSLGRCSAKVDLVNILLGKIKPAAPPPPPSIAAPTLNLKPSLPSSFRFPSPGISATFQSAIPSFTSSFFSPGPKSGPASVFSPLSGNFLSATSLKSPTSPFFKAISASMRPRRRHFIQPCSRLKDATNISSLSALKSVNVSITSIKLAASSQSSLAPYRAVVTSVEVKVGLPESISRHHEKWLGSRAAVEKYDPDTYVLDISLSQLNLEKGHKHDTLPLVRVGKMTCQGVAHQWPAPFLVVSPFMRGDPNGPFLGLSLHVENIEATQRLDQLHQLLDCIPSSASTPPQTPNPLHSLPPLALPRVVFSLECGSICTCLIFSANSGQGLRALELKTDGFSIGLQSEYGHASSAILKLYPTSSSVLPVQMESKLDAVLRPITIRTRVTKDLLDNPERNLIDDPSVLTMGQLELLGTVRAVAETDGPAEGIAVLDRSSIACDCQVMMDTICVELWNPVVVDSVHQILSLIPARKPVPRKSPPSHTPLPRFRQLPIGMSAKASLAQFVVFVTAPDINPNDKIELSRGLSLRCGVALEHCCIKPSHEHWYDDNSHLERRTRLYLPVTSVLQDAVSVGKQSSSSQRDSAFIRARVYHSVVRSLVATQFEPSEPLIAERLDAPHLSQDFLRVRDIQLDVCLSSGQADDTTQDPDACDIAIRIPSIRGDFKLAHVYSILLAVQTLESLQTRRGNSKPASKPVPKLSLLLQLNINTVQIYWTLPKRNIVSRLDGFSAGFSPTGPPRLGLDQALVFVPLPSRVNRWETEEPGRWDELLRLQKWEAFLSPYDHSLSVAIHGESARLRIPSGFVFHDLVLDASIMIKALKHIAHITKAGRYWQVPSPESEGPKSVPHLTFRLGFLCLEAQDDPFECKLGLMWQTGSEALKQRMEREEAFSAKVAAIMLAEQQSATLPQMDRDYQFGSKHSIPIQDARRRMDDVHALDWALRLEKLRNIRLKDEDATIHRLFGTRRTPIAHPEPNLVPLVERAADNPPLLRAALHNLNLTICPPSFPIDELSTFLSIQGSGLPRDTEFSLLIPMHLHFTLSAFRVTLRDYPIPLLDILPHEDPLQTVWTFDTDLVIAEEMGTGLSVEWIECPIIEQENAHHGEKSWSLVVPKTIMPVKTYANASIAVKSPHPMILGWGISYGSTIQDLMRVIETLTSPPQDPSPIMGFWDKIRLIMHWKLDVKFVGDVQVYLKGSRDPYNTLDTGAGFVLGWQGSPRIRVGFENEERELIQITSDMMLIAVPDLEHIAPNSFLPGSSRTLGIPKPFKKVCARLSSGVRFGIGFLPERSCGVECLNCSGLPSQRNCRLFAFKPHYMVILEKKPFLPDIKGPGDSYNGFRSDFVHLSFSLESGLKKVLHKHPADRDYSSLHLTPKIFAHFWAWCSLFDGVLTLPIRQGNYYPPKPVSPKLGRHIATLKYRIHIPHLYVMHGYMDESRETWVDGVTSWVGVKGMVDELQVDMHQREEESMVPGPIPGTTRILRRKPFNAAEVVLKGLDLRTLLATFLDPLKKNVPIAAPLQRSNYRKHSDLPGTSVSSPWHDQNDFTELDWKPRGEPVLQLLPVAMCPRFSYFKRSSSPQAHFATNKFGLEDSHRCLLEKEPSAPRVQVLLASARAAELRRLIRKASQKGLGKLKFDQGMAEKMVSLLEDYVTVLQNFDAGNEPQESDPQTYFLSSEIVSSAEWAEFENVYQIHCPSVFLDSAIRDIMMQYYYCSRARKGLEYHMATRAVKFIRDQANAALAADTVEGDKPEAQQGNPYLAASTLRKILGTDTVKKCIEVSEEKKVYPPQQVDPLDGWTSGVSLRKSHCCLLLKPQIVLHGTEPKDTCIVAASQAKLQSFGIMDVLNSDDPISGKVMSRNYMSLSGMQVYAPTNPLASRNSSIPLEVLIDLRCETKQFERLVPQTDAVFHYDKFNRLRLRNGLTSSLTRATADETGTGSNNHLQDQTDLIRIHIPRFTVSANTEHFQAISNIVTKLLLFSDPAHKTRLDRLETLIFTYDFRDLASAANVISNLQGRLREALETEKLTQRTQRSARRLEEEDGRISAFKLKAHIFLLEEELNLLFDAIKLAQDRFDASAERNNALLLRASSSEISWQMLDDRRNVLAKLVVQDIDFHWLNRQDSSTVNHLTVGNLTAFDGSRYAIWAEIISKFDEPANDPLSKKGLFCLANWTILAPVGGITIYENFELFFHPLRLQIDAKVGQRIMEYVWPGRKERHRKREPKAIPEPPKTPVTSRTSIDSPRALQGPKPTSEILLASPRKLGTSRSFTDLRSTLEHGFLTAPTFLHRNRSNESLNNDSAAGPDPTLPTLQGGTNGSSDAAVMKTRSSQKSFVFVRIASLNLMLSIVKEGSFECHDARIKTRDLEYRNQTWSFEELVNQFIPSNMSWRGWVKMAFHQPLLPVLPVAKELLSKTKWTANKSGPQIHDHPLKLLHPRLLAADDDSRLNWLQTEASTSTVSTPPRSWKNALRTKTETNLILPTEPLSAEPTPIKESDKGSIRQSNGRKRVKSLFSRGNKSSSKGETVPDIPTDPSGS